ncbi:MAG: Gfo/Idh/MocA family oxidoreductase [Verrucomicrobia bacterium]|nr:Gfo/Idh/MocA family oxidoreductase [Verrucomicrobiota bacterium]
MTPSSVPAPMTRRQFVKHGSSVAVGTAALGGFLPAVHAADDHTIRLALIGCGNRGTGAVADALNVKGEGPIKLHLMVDLSESRMATAHDALKQKFPNQVDVPPERRLVGFDAYKQAIDSLRPGDVAMCTTRAYIRPVHVEYAVKKGINVFMEKPFAPDPVGLRRLLKAGEEADRKGVKILAGFQCRHSPARQALIAQIRDGLLGDIHLIRANRLGGAGWLGNQGEKANRLVDQLQFGKSHLHWIGSGQMVDNLIHQVDECCWIKDAWPVSVVGMGGRVPGSKDCGQNIDVYSMEYTFADGTKAFCGFRRINRTRTDFATYLHGTKCAAQFSGNVHAATVHRFKDQRIDKGNIAWTPTPDAHSPWQYEWNEFIASIRRDRPHNETKRAVYSDFATLMGRAACHTGQVVTWDEILKSNFQWCDYLDTLTADSPPPIKAGPDGQFPVPIPGQWKEV